MKKLSADQVIKRLMEAYDAYDEMALCAKMERDIATLRTWKSRGNVPLKSLVEASESTGYSVEWLRGEEGAKKSANKRTPADDRAAALLTQREVELIDRYRRLPDKLRLHVEDAALLAVLAYGDRKAYHDATGDEV